MSLLSYWDFLKESKQSIFKTTVITSESTVNESGAYGHLSHPFEDMDLTMDDLEQLIKTTVAGAFEPQNFVLEKTDGQNLMFSWKNGQIIFARSQKHLKNFGEQALDIAGIADMFLGRGDMEQPFIGAVLDLNKMLAACSDKDREHFFGEG